jgi:bifunctional DNA-binding transcriptional regulator/antitoxin component of YhaV-PrlF toxin-antitoxin module
MQLVTVKTKYQIVIPRAIPEQAGVGIGDLLEASVEKGKITFSPKSVVDRHLAEGLEDLKRGRTHGPYKSAKDAMAALEARANKRLKRR